MAEAGGGVKPEGAKDPNIVSIKVRGQVTNLSLSFDSSAGSPMCCGVGRLRGLLQDQAEIGIENADGRVRAAARRNPGCLPVHLRRQPHRGDCHAGRREWRVPHGLIKMSDTERFRACSLRWKTMTSLTPCWNRLGEDSWWARNRSRETPVVVMWLP